MSGSNCFDLGRPAFAPPGHAALVESAATRPNQRSPTSVASPQPGTLPSQNSKPWAAVAAPIPGPRLRATESPTSMTRNGAAGPGAAGVGRAAAAARSPAAGGGASSARGHLWNARGIVPDGRDHERDHEGRGAGRYEHAGPTNRAARRGGWVARRCNTSRSRSRTSPRGAAPATMPRRAGCEPRRGTRRSASARGRGRTRSMPIARERRRSTARAPSGPAPFGSRDARDHDRDEHGGEREAAAVLPGRRSRRSSSR